MTTIDDTFNKTISDLGLSKTEPRKEKTELGQDEFLKLMITQLKNQDPFKPLENGDFIAQMAQFSSVSGLENLQKSFESLATSMQSNQALQASTMVGREVVVPTDNALVSNGSGISGSIYLPSSGGNITMNIESSTGELVREFTLGQHAAGDINFQWDGRNANGDVVPSGKYFFRASANIEGNSEPEALETFVSAKVESVTLNPKTRGITLNLMDLGSVAFSDIKEIR